MGISFNNDTISPTFINFENQSVSEVYFNGIKVWPGSDNTPTVTMPHVLSRAVYNGKAYTYITLTDGENLTSSSETGVSTGNRISVLNKDNIINIYNLRRGSAVTKYANTITRIWSKRGSSDSTTDVVLNETGTIPSGSTASVTSTYTFKGPMGNIYGDSVESAIRIVSQCTEDGDTYRTNITITYVM